MGYAIVGVLSFIAGAVVTELFGTGILAKLKTEFATLKTDLLNEITALKSKL